MDPSTPENRFGEVWILVVVCAVALIVRLLYLGEWAATPLFHTPLGDELNFHDTALALLGRGATVGVSARIDLTD